MNVKANTKQTLTAAGITPDASKTYTLAALQAAIKGEFGFEVVLNCQSGALSEVWYFYNVQGSAQTGLYHATSPSGSASTCPSSGIKWLPKSGGSTTTTTSGGGSPTTTTTSTGPTGTSGPFSGKGYLEVTTGGAAKGCLISTGMWYTSGTCATYTVATSGSGFTLTTSKGKCGIVSGAFTCGSSVAAATFTSTGGKLTANNASTFYAASVPSGSTQIAVGTTKAATTLTITFQAV
jgi:ribonuclease T2